MNKIKYLFSRIREMNFDKMFLIINEINLKTKKSKIIILIDIIWCGLYYLAGYMDYYIFEMYDLNFKQRKTVMTRGINNKYIKKLNDPKYWHLFDLKDEFNRKYQNYLKRDWLFVEKKEQLENFIKDKEYIIAKPRNGTCGRGIEKIRINDHSDLFSYLVNKELLVIEELVVQHDLINKLHSDSVNTLRMITIFNGKEAQLAAVYMRIGNGKHVDNFNSGGMVVPVDIELGEIFYPAYDKAKNLYETHPKTGHRIKGFKIPFYQEAVNMVQEVAKIVPDVGIVGWDVAITNEGPLLIEANNFPGHDIYQLPPHRTNGIGVLPNFEKIFKI